MFTFKTKTGLLLAAVLLGPVTTTGAADRQPLSFAVVPQQAAAPLAKAWEPLLVHLAAKTGTPFHFQTTSDIPAFERRLAAGAYDFAYMNPYHYTEFERRVGYRAFARENLQLVGLLVVRADAEIASPAALAGARLAFPAPAAFAASVLPRAYLRAQGIAFTPRYVSSHDSVYRAVAAGLYPAGGGIERTFENLAPELRGQLRVLWRSPPHPPHAFAVHPRIPAAVVRRVQAAMTALHTEPEGRALLERLAMQRLVVASGKDWDALRTTDLKFPELGASREGP